MITVPDFCVGVGLGELDRNLLQHEVPLGNDSLSISLKSSRNELCKLVYTTWSLLTTNNGTYHLRSQSELGDKAI